MIDTASVSTFAMQPISGQSRAVTSRGCGTASPAFAIDASRSSTVDGLRMAGRGLRVAVGL